MPTVVTKDGRREENRALSAGVGVCARHLLEGAQVAVEDVKCAEIENQVTDALVERVYLLLDAPKLDASVGEIREEQIELVVGNLDVFRAQRLRQHLAAPGSIFNHAARVEGCL
jgi:hypothetical protein